MYCHYAGGAHAELSGRGYPNNILQDALTPSTEKDGQMHGVISIEKETFQFLNHRV